MGEIVNLDVTTLEESVSVTTTDGGTVEVAVQAEKGDTGPAGPAGPNTVTSATTSDGTANLSLSNVTTATATVTGTLTASHIHGNLAGSVYAHVRAGENLAKGDPVYVSGAHGSGATLIPIVSKADASDPLKMPAVGVMDAAVTNNANGHMVITGTITEIDTNAFAVNAELYVAAGGGFTATPPTGLCQPVARVERSNTNNGAVIVKVNGLSSKSAIDNTLVRRGENGDVSFATSANDTSTLNLESNGDFGGTAYPSAVKAFASGSLGVGAEIYSNSGWGAVIASNTNTGALISTNSGNYHADFGSGDNRSAIERVRGWFVWFYNTFTGRLKTADITANRDWTLPDASGTIALTTSNVATATALQTARTINGVSFNGTANITITVPVSTGITGLGTSVATALAVNVGSAGAFVVNGGALGTPSSGTLTNCTGLPINTGVSGLGANVATMLASFTSANIRTACTNPTGTDSLVFANSPTITTPTIARSGNGTVATFQDGSGKTVTVETASFGTQMTLNGTGGTLGTYLTLNGQLESWVNVISLTNTTDLRVMRFGNGSNAQRDRFSIQRLNDTSTIIRATPFSLANNAPTNSFYMHASGGVSYGNTTDPGAGNIGLNGNQIVIATSQTPASATAAGTAGTICWDANYIYVCINTNTWRRIAHATW